MKLLNVNISFDQHLRVLPAYGCRHSQLRLIHKHIMKTANVKKTFSKLEAGTARIWVQAQPTLIDSKTEDEASKHKSDL